MLIVRRLHSSDCRNRGIDCTWSFDGMCWVFQIISWLSWSTSEMLKIFILWSAIIITVDVLVHASNRFKATDFLNVPPIHVHRFYLNVLHHLVLFLCWFSDFSVLICARTIILWLYFNLHALSVKTPPNLGSFSWLVTLFLRTEWCKLKEKLKLKENWN